MIIRKPDLSNLMRTEKSLFRYDKSGIQLLLSIQPINLTTLFKTSPSDVIDILDDLLEKDLSKQHHNDVLQVLQEFRTKSINTHC